MTQILNLQRNEIDQLECGECISIYGERVTENENTDAPFVEETDNMTSMDANSDVDNEQIMSKKKNIVNGKTDITLKHT